MGGTRTYVGLSTSCRRSSIAIVSSAGELQFAQGGERILERNGGPAYSETLARLIDRYCNAETEIVLALATNNHPPDPHAGEPHLLGPRGPETEAGNVQYECRGAPMALRAGEATSAFAKRCQSQLLSHLEIAFGYELERVRGWKDGVLETRRYSTHLCHAAAACFTGPYAEALCAVLDGSDDHSCNCYVYKDGALFEMNPAHKPKREGSLGALYRDICNACGFQAAFGEHWKVMALSRHGAFDSDIHNFLKAYVWAEGLSLRTVNQKDMILLYDKLDAVSRRPGEPILSAANLACTAQAIFEETLCTFLQNLHATGVSDNLVFTGECVLNTSANGSILECTAFKRLHIPSAPDADGNAVGAALLAYQEDEHMMNAHPRFQNPYLGFEFQGDEFEAAANGSTSCTVTQCDHDSAQQAARILATGKTVGWINGRAEFASRTLGNRSVLADPRRAGAHPYISKNSADTIRPFGIAILHEYGSEYFDGYQTSPYGERALKFRLKAARKIPWAVQRDDRPQVQSIRRDWNERLYDLIFAFYRITGIPLVMNMNYEVADGSLAETIEEVFVTFSKCKIDALFVDDMLIMKQ